MLCRWLRVLVFSCARLCYLDSVPRSSAVVDYKIVLCSHTKQEYDVRQRRRPTPRADVTSTTSAVSTTSTVSTACSRQFAPPSSSAPAPAPPASNPLKRQTVQTHACVLHPLRSPPTLYIMSGKGGKGGKGK